MDRAKIGIVGCGDILDAYMVGLDRFAALGEVARVCDVDLERVTVASSKYAIPRAGTVEDLWQDESIDIVVSLTPPQIHHEIIQAAAIAGKDVYTEKPLSASTDRARSALAHAKEASITVGSAPDTFLGPAAQSARAVIDRGDIGDPIAVVAFAPYNRAERRHPNPGFLFQAGAGPLLDIPPYHLTCLVHLLGPVHAVSAMSRRSAPVRTIRSVTGETIEIPVEVDTHVTANLEFASGVLGTFIGSFDIWSHRLPPIEVYGSQGSLSLPHPNWYDGRVEIKLHDDEDWREIAPVFAPIQTHAIEKVRGLGVLDLIASRRGEPHRTNSELAFHVLEVLEGMSHSADQGAPVTIQSRPERPAPLTSEEIDAWRS